MILVATLLAAAALTPKPIIAVDLKRPAVEGLSLTVVQGAEPLAWAGTALAAGDINGDGIADLVIGAPGGSDDRPSRRGRIYVLYGGVARRRANVDLAIKRRPASNESGKAVVASEADIIIDGRDDFDHLGAALAVADTDGDGFADIIAGAPRADGPANARTDCGEVVIVHGATNLPPRIDLAAIEAGGSSAAPRARVIMGRSAGDAFGSALAVGDVNGDGLLDLVVGAPLSDQNPGPMGSLDAGECYLLPGTRSPRGVVDLADASSAAQVTVLRGTDHSDQVGSAIALGDFDGDGLDDIVTSSRAADGPMNQRPDSGEITLMFGERRDASSASLGLPAAAVFLAPNIGDLMGGSLAMGDFNGDGMADVAIGAAMADGAGNAHFDAGEIHLVLGRRRADLETQRSPQPPARAGSTTEEASLGPVVIDLARTDVPGVWTLHGSDPGDHLGVRAMTDLDGDGAAELIAGAEDSSSRRNSRGGGGEVVILYGGALPAHAATAPSGRASVRGAVLYGALGGGHLGRAAVAVDLDGDGRPEVAVSAPSSGQSLSGRVYILSRGRDDVMRPPGRK